MKKRKRIPKQSKLREECRISFVMSSLYDYKIRSLKNFLYLS